MTICKLADKSWYDVHRVYTYRNEEGCEQTVSDENPQTLL